MMITRTEKPAGKPELMTVRVCLFFGYARRNTGTGNRVRQKHFNCKIVYYMDLTK
jgi:hypothetical protein